MWQLRLARLPGLLNFYLQQASWKRTSWTFLLEWQMCSSVRTQRLHLPCPDATQRGCSIYKTSFPQQTEWQEMETVESMFGIVNLKLFDLRSMGAGKQKKWIPRNIYLGGYQGSSWVFPGDYGPAALRQNFAARYSSLDDTRCCLVTWKKS